MDWITRNSLLLIGGVLIPLSVITSLMILAFGGFSEEQLTTLFPLGFLASYSAIYFICWRKALSRHKRDGDYGYWDMFPIFYFVGAFLLLFSA